MPYVVSSAIRRIEWEAGTLSIWFKQNGPYNHYNVPESVFKAFLAAPSKGEFYNENIKDRY